MIIKPNPLPAFRELYELPEGTWMVINIGGRGSGKSYEASKFVTLQALAKNKRTVVLRDEKVSIRESILNEIQMRFEEINEKSEGVFSKRYEMQENTLREKGTKRSLIFTKGFRTSSNNKVANLKSISDIDIALIEEFEDITNETKFNTLADSIRNRESIIFINSNIPDMNHWFIKRFFDLKDTEYDGYFELVPRKIEGVVYIMSNYTGNPHLPEHIKRKYPAYGDPLSPFYDLHYYLTQILGLCSSGREGQIHKNWKRISNSDFNLIDLPSRYGLDFGWSDSPMALSELKIGKGRAYRRQLLYRRNISLLDLAIEMIRLGITPDDLVVADCAEPLSINKLRNGWAVDELPTGYADKYPQLLNGFYVMSAVKGPGSIQAGINKVKEYENYLTEESTDWWNEYVNYCWAKDKNGNPTDDPIDDYNHLFDADRYVVMAKGRLY